MIYLAVWSPKKKFHSKVPLVWFVGLLSIIDLKTTTVEAHDYYSNNNSRNLPEEFLAKCKLIDISELPLPADDRTRSRSISINSSESEMYEICTKDQNNNHEILDENLEELDPLTKLFQNAFSGMKKTKLFNTTNSGTNFWRNWD